MRTRGLILGALVAGLAGCWVPSSRTYRSYDYAFVDNARLAYTPATVRQPESGVDAAEVTSALDALAQREAEATARAEAWAAERAALPVERALGELREAYARADAPAAEALVASHPRLVNWDDAQRDGTIALRSAFERRENGEGFLLVSMSLAATQASAPALAVAIPPGTYAVAATVGPQAEGGFEGERWTRPDQDRRYGHWPAVQDLACLGADAVILTGADPVVTVRIPVACASFEKKAPQHGMQFTLQRFPRGSAVERLLVQLCADRAKPPEPAEAQLAVWLARNRLSWSSFVREGGTLGRLATFSGNQPITSGAAQGAATLLLESGTDPRGLGFFKDGEERGQADVPAAELLPEPSAEPEPAEPEPEQPAAPEGPTEPEQPAEVLTAAA